MKALVSLFFIVLSISLPKNVFAWSLDFSSTLQTKVFKYIKKKKHHKLNKLLSLNPELSNSHHPYKDISPILYALNKRHPQSVEIIIEHGEQSDRNSDYEKIWDISLKNHDWQSLDVLLKNLDSLPDGTQELTKSEADIFDNGWKVFSEESKIQLENIFGYQEIGDALRNKSEDTIIEILNSGQYNKVQDFMAKTHSSILSWAIENSLSDLVRTAINFGAQVNQQVNGISPLQNAMLKKNDQIAILLILNGADIHRGMKVDRQQKSFLHLAIEQKSYRVAKALISMGANLEERNAKGLSAKKIINDQKIYALSAYLVQKKILDKLQNILYNQLPKLDLESYTAPTAKVHFYKLFEGFEHLKMPHPEGNGDDDCPICFEPFQHNAHSCMNSNCKFGDQPFKICFNCLKDSLKIQIKDYAYPLHCDHCGVEQIFSREDIHQLGLQEFTEDVELQTYIAYFKEMFPTAKNCSTPNCSNLIREIDCDNQGHYQCLCGSTYCFSCGENHRGVDCQAHEDNKKYLAKNPFGQKMHDPASDLRPCPYCYKPFMKDDKCNYVICPNCKNKWDFIKGKWRFGSDHNHRTDGFNENWKKGKRTYRIPGDLDSNTGKPYTAYVEGVRD
ncbi:MAG: ankyrin repeat domain-containing protein [Oligoflexales bacterium]